MNLFQLIRRILLALYNRLLIIIDPVLYARSIGVRLGTGVRFYGAAPGMFGTEPWLITIGNNVHIVSGCYFVNHDGGVLILRNKYPDLEITKPIVIGNNVYIGLNCILLPGTCIGDNVVVGAGSVVTGNVPGNTVVAGVPARVIKSIDQYLAQAQANSLGFGALKGRSKEVALKKYFSVGHK